MKMLIGLTVLSFFSACFSQAALALGFIAGAGVHGIASSFRAIEEEDTPNFNGYGLNFQGGITLWESIDLTAMADYSTLDEGQFRLAGARSQLVATGLDLSARLGGSAVLGFTYQLAFLNSRFSDEDFGSLRSKWQGGLFGLRLGGVISSSRDKELQLALNYRNGTMRQKKSSQAIPNLPQERTVDTLALGVTYLFKQQVRRRWWR